MIEVNIIFLLEKGNFTEITLNLSLYPRVIFNVFLFSQRNSRNQIFIQVFILVDKVGDFMVFIKKISRTWFDFYPDMIKQQKKTV